MGNNTLSTKNINDLSDASDINQFKEALSENHLPRNIAGTPTDLAGSLGAEEIKWLKANIVNGYWSAGDIKPHHSYNGTAPIDNGWFPCDGTVINEANYDAIHDAGAWDEFVGTSIFDGKYSPDLTAKYLSGAASTAQDGTTSFTTVGNASNEIDLEHGHTGFDHNHNWYVAGSGSPTYSAIVANSVQGAEGTYNSSGSAINMPVTGTAPLSSNCYTNNANAGTSDAMSTNQDIRPDSIEVTYYIRVI